MWYFIAFLIGAIAGFLVGKKNGQRVGDVAQRLKDTLGKK